VNEDSPGARAHCFGPFRIEPLERRLLRDGVAVPLTPKAFDLLLALVENPGRLLEKDALLKRVWKDAFVEEANLANNISVLRKTLGEQAGGAEYIETVPRRGYRFLAKVEPHGNRDAEQDVGTSPPDPLPAPVPAVTSSLRPRTRQLIPASVALLILVAVAIATRQVGSGGSIPQVVRFAVAPPFGTVFPSTSEPMSPAVSPDGAHLVFRVLRQGEPVLAIRAIDAVETRILAGTEDGHFPFWSPDGRVVAFFANGKLKKVDVAGGPVQIICDAIPGYGGTWNRDGVIVFAPSATDGLFRVPASGGQPMRVTGLQHNEAFHRHPQFLPDGRRFLYFAAPESIYVGSLDGAAPVPVLTSRRAALYSSPGYILYLQDRTLFAQPFDADRVRLIGDPVPIADHIRTGGTNVGGRPAGGAAVSISGNGMLAYGTDIPVKANLTWFDRAGRTLESVGPFPFDRFIDFELSPDATRVAFAAVTQPFANDVWVFDLTKGHSTQLTFNSASNRRPMWSPDGRRLAFASMRRDGAGFYQKMVTGQEPDERVLPTERNQITWPNDWTSKGILYRSQSNDDVWILPVDGERTPRTVGGPAIQPDVKASPDVEWLAYTSNESGRPEVVVQSVATTAVKHRISTSGGSMPRWRRDGKELFYLSADGTLMSVLIEHLDAGISPGIPKPLFATALTAMPPPLRSFGVAPDGQRFLLATSREAGPTTSPVVVSNWTALLHRR
jgi:DNA-binding winged helix-turn-helix (wHTH) protein/Tol biopolymer transport system component